MVKHNVRVLIMAGGTGGHVFPALAIARYLEVQGHQVTWLGTRKGLEASVVPAADFAIEYISVTGLRGKGLAGWLLAPIKLSYAVLQSVRVLLRIKPQVVLGLGGFVTGPGGLAAWLLRIPLVVHEQNAIPGLTNRLLSHLSKHVLEAFNGSFPVTTRAVHTGNPVRQEIAALTEPATRLQQHQGPLRILLVGGSLGAQALNECLPEALALLHKEERPEVWHQTGKNKYTATAQHYHRLQIDARIVEFIDDMAEAYTWADMVICRAGALTISELCAAGLGAVLVPFPYAVDDHQTHNAQYLVQGKAGILLSQNELNKERLAQLLRELIDKGRAQAIKFACAARDLAMPKATEHVAQLCLEAAHD